MYFPCVQWGRSLQLSKWKSNWDLRNWWPPQYKGYPWILLYKGMDGTWTHDLWFTRPTPCHLATTPHRRASYATSTEFLAYLLVCGKIGQRKRGTIRCVQSMYQILVVVLSYSVRLCYISCDNCVQLSVWRYKQPLWILTFICTVVSRYSSTEVSLFEPWCPSAMQRLA